MHTRIISAGLFAFAIVLASGAAGAASTVQLPATACPAAETLFHDGWEAIAIPHLASNGSGGVFPGNVTRTIYVPGIGTRAYYLHLPSNYTPTHGWPILLALRGASYAGSEDTQALQIRSDWSTVSDSGGFIVIALAGTSFPSNGLVGWGGPHDIDEINAALADAFAHYNIEQSRIYLWGFSAGAHYAHGLALASPNFFAAYGVSAGSLEQYACTDNGSYPPTCASLLAGVSPKIPVDIHLGLVDPYYTQYGAGNDATRFQNGGWKRGQTVFYTLFAGGHIYTVAQLGQIWNNICPFALGP
ncbi:MAG: hypothetical protein ABJB02_10500 [Dokdonella sp.]